MKRGLTLVALVTAAAAAIVLVSPPHHAPPKDRSAPSTSASATSPPSPSTSSAPSLSVPPPSGPALVGLRLAGTNTVVPEPADAVAAIRDGVVAPGVPVGPEQLAMVTSSSDSLTCLVDLAMAGRPPVLVTARLVNGRWTLVGPR
jgi:hypothetical protein